MLNFFRKYQKIFFLFTTLIIVMSFVFFGTYQAIAPSFRGKGEEEGSYVTQMTHFLNSENWMVSRKFFGTNFLNDGVISKEFLETGMGEIVAAHSLDRFQKDFEMRHEKEKSYTPYTHPYVPSLSAMSVWSMFSPDIPVKLKAFQEGKGIFKERNALFLAQKSFPPAFISQVIRYQEQNNPQIPPDPRLAKDDITLFGYHELTDWYGEAFVETLAQVIIQSADIARKQGFKVSKDELLAELISRSQDVYNELKDRVSLPVENGYGLFQLYLRQMGMQEQTALKIWEDVTLFRRLMHAVGDAALVDTLPLSQFYSYAYENVLVEVIQMSKESRLKSMEDLKRFEVYLAAVGEKRSSLLDIPLEYAPLEQIESHAPELVGKCYQIYYAETSKKALQSKVSIKETLQWECEQENWKTLQRQFPELAQKTGSSFDILESMDEKGRKLVDTFARKQIVEAHPEWIKEALTEAEMDEKELFLSSKSEIPFEGIKDTQAFVSALENQDELIGYTQDQKHYYRFLIKEKGTEKKILTYGEAVKMGVLDKISERMQGEALLKAIVDATPAKYRGEAYAYRFAQFINQYKETLPEGKLVKQFPIDKKEKTITRSESSFIALDEVLALVKGAFSEMKIHSAEGAYLYRFIEKRIDGTLPLDKIVQSQELLSKEARCRYFENLLSQIEEV